MLADARHEGPVPPEVAARLDEALAGLRAEESPEAPVVPLRRRSARLPRYLLAAAAVVAIGFGTTQVITDTREPTGDSSSAGSESDSGADATRDGGAESGDSPSAADGAAPPEAFVPLDELGIEGLEPLRRATLDEDVAALEDTKKQESTLRSTRRLAARCGPLDRVPGSRTLAAAYDGRPTLVVYLAPEGGSQRVDLYLCDTAEPRRAFRSVTLSPGE